MPWSAVPVTNFGWRLFEGTTFVEGSASEPEGYVGPVCDVRHVDGDCSVTGGVEMRGVYLFGDYCSSKYWVLVGDKTTPVDVDVPAPVSFGQDGAGNLLVASGDGGVYALTPELSRHTPARFRGASRRGV